MSDIQKILVDADAFVAFLKKDDTHHTKSLGILEKLKQNIDTKMLLASNYVFAEAITVISQRVSKKAAHAFIEQMKSSDSPFTFLWIDEELEDRAIKIFKEQRSKNVSFVDCTNMAILRQHSLTTIFSFDAIYKKNGFKLAGE